MKPCSGMTEKELRENIYALAAAAMRRLIETPEATKIAVRRLLKDAY